MNPDAEQQPELSTAMWRFLPLLSSRIVAARPPFSVVFTLCVPTMRWCTGLPLACSGSIMTR